MARRISYKGDGTDVINDMKKNLKIIGVVKDFNFASLRTNVTPLVLAMRNDWMASLSIRTNTTNLPGLMQQIEGK